MTQELTLAEKLERIRTLNDAARRNPGVACRANMTSGFANLPHADRFAALRQVVAFDQFNGDNDPYVERDFGAIYQLATGEWDQRRPADERAIVQTVFWKIDYYDNRLEYGSEAPWDDAKTTRVMTIMLASEY